MKNSLIKAIALVLAVGIGAGVLASCGTSPDANVESKTETSGQIQKTDAPEASATPESATSTDVAE